jgi:phosphomannomutase
LKKSILKKDYVAAVCAFADMDLIAKSNFKFAVDAMYGSGRGVLSGIFRGARHPVRGDSRGTESAVSRHQSRADSTAYAMLQETVVREKCDAGLATDGDADRIGAVAEDGSFVDSHKIFCVLLRWLLERKKWPGDVVRAFNTTRMLDRIAAKYGRKIARNQDRFKYIADLMMEREILIGGEESGGIGYSRFCRSATVC